MTASLLGNMEGGKWHKDEIKVFKRNKKAIWGHSSIGTNNSIFLKAYPVSIVLHYASRIIHACDNNPE